MLPVTLRTEKEEREYQRAKELGSLLPLHQEKRIHDFKYWFIVENRFPYDMVFKTHDMLLPMRKVCVRAELNPEEKAELETILEYYVEPRYDLFFENTQKRRSVMAHYHIHLASYVNERDEFKG